jgi:hypothetical protein
MFCIPADVARMRQNETVRSPRHLVVKPQAQPGAA